MNREDIIRMAQETGVTAERVRDLVNFAALVASAEREACWDIVGIALLGSDRELTKRVAAAIRARSKE